MEKSTHIRFPRWASVLYGLLIVGLIPWIFNLANNLPTRHLVRHWDAVWVGFDVIILLTAALTVIFVIKGKVWVAISASALATLFLVDAWFDILTAKPGKEQKIAILFGGLEIILAALTYRLVFYVVRESSPQKNIKLFAGEHQ